MVGVAYFTQNPDVTLSDPEAAFIALGQIFFHPFIAGLMMAAVLAATMSTVSSQLLVTSCALVEDIYKAIFRTDATQKTARKLKLYRRFSRTPDRDDFRMAAK